MLLSKSLKWVSKRNFNGLKFSGCQHLASREFSASPLKLQSDAEPQTATESAPVVVKKSRKKAAPKKAPEPEVAVDLGGISIVETLEELDQWMQNFREEQQVSFSAQVSQPLPESKQHDQELAGIAFALKSGESCYVPIIRPEDQTLRWELVERLRELFADDSVRKVSYNVKEQIKMLTRLPRDPITMGRNVEDVMVLSYVLNCGSYDHHDFTSLASTLQIGTGRKSLRMELKQLVGTPTKYKPFSKCPKELQAKVVAERVQDVNEMFHLLWGRMQCESAVIMYRNNLNHPLRTFYEMVEKPLVSVLADMELTGIKVNRASLEEMTGGHETNIESKTAELAKAVGDLAPPDFNYNSPQQLMEVLTKLNLFKLIDVDPTGDKNPGTGAEVLKAMAKQASSKTPEELERMGVQGAQLPKLVLDLRAITKLKGTYTDGLCQHINPKSGGRIHTSFQNALTHTGRLSSTSPNLQNIPMRTDDGRKIRKTFVAEEGRSIIKADYSQVELRILAHIANVPVLKSAFLEGRDVHAITASEVFNVPLDQVTSDIRQKAKAINFGIIYGMSEFGLSKRIGVTKTEAKSYILGYFKKYPGIQDYMMRTQEFCRQHEYVTTLFGRRCYVPEIKSGDSGQQAYAERAAINTPIQGTSADITKLAMVDIFHRLKEERLKTKMILQVHDELVFEAPHEELEHVQPLIKELMEQAAVKRIPEFTIPLTVDLKTGPGWVE